MLLCVNHGIFYEFIPADEFFNPNPTRISLSDVKMGVNYVIILNTNAGLWGYNLGDTIKFVSTDPVFKDVKKSIAIKIKCFTEFESREVAIDLVKDIRVNLVARKHDQAGALLLA